jgi:hypothetical protein
VGVAFFNSDAKWTFEFLFVRSSAGQSEQVDFRNLLVQLWPFSNARTIRPPTIATLFGLFAVDQIQQ